eukprot:m.192911 g.192911  ORF g.192911 m.192911 type:complete len:169 (-) comp10063_c0_seq2:586-1092(-)
MRPTPALRACSTRVLFALVISLFACRGHSFTCQLYSDNSIDFLTVRTPFNALPAVDDTGCRDTCCANTFCKQAKYYRTWTGDKLFGCSVGGTCCMLFDSFSPVGAAGSDAGIAITGSPLGCSSTVFNDGQFVSVTPYPVVLHVRVNDSITVSLTATDSPSQLNERSTR